MSVYIQPTNFDELFHRTTGEKFILNNLDPFDPVVKEQIDHAILKHYGKDDFCVIPSCNCGKIKSASKIGHMCSSCNTTVKNSLEDNYNFLVWFKQPIGLQKFISPDLLSILDLRYELSRPKLSVIRYLIDTRFKVDRSKQRVNLANFDRLTTILEAHGIERGYNNFVENMVEICTVLEKELVKSKQLDVEFLDFLAENKEKFLSEYLPFPNRVLFATEQNELGKFTQLNTTSPGVDIVRSLAGIDLQVKKPRAKQDRVGGRLLDLAEFYREYAKANFYKKPGEIRQHIASTRSHFTARAVVVAIAGPHKYDELHVPWTIAIGLFRPHILGKLTRRGYTWKKADELLRVYARQYHPVLREIFDELISEAYNGIDVLLGRNPSLHRGSLLHMRITNIKSNPTDCTIEISALAVRPLNADMDGDELNIILITNKVVHQFLDNFDYHHSLLVLSGVNEIGNAISYPKTIVGNLANWYGTGE